MAILASAARDELIAYQCTDAIVNGALEAAFTAVSAFDPAASLDEIRLCILNPASASPALLESPYFTAGCQALLAEKLIIVNEQFLLEIETALRSFAQSRRLTDSQYIKHDSEMFGLLRRIQQDPVRYLARLRRSAGADSELEAQIRQQLALTVLFFIGHELGHFLHGHATGEYASFVDPTKPLESRIEDAVVRLCRHVDEFSPARFTLGGFKETSDTGSDIRKAAEALRARDSRRYDLQEMYFANEADADEWANRVVIAHLKTLPQSDAQHALYCFACGIFVAALYSWYRDLDLFANKLGSGRISNTPQIGFQMLQGREKYIHAASLFGDRHRFTLLRATLALEAVIKAHTRWFDLPENNRSIWSNDEDQFWLMESLQRYFLLCANMDTAVKLASVGCATGWIVEADRKRRTPQLFIMQFYGMDHALSRVKQIP